MCFLFYVVMLWTLAWESVICWTSVQMGCSGLHTKCHVTNALHDFNSCLIDYGHFFFIFRYHMHVDGWCCHLSCYYLGWSFRRKAAIWKIPVRPRRLWSGICFLTWGKHYTSKLWVFCFWVCKRSSFRVGVCCPSCINYITDMFYYCTVISGKNCLIWDIYVMNTVTNVLGSCPTMKYNKLTSLFETQDGS